MKRLAVEVLRSASNASAGPSQRPICQLNCGIRKLSGYEISKPKSHRSISLRFNSSNAPARAPISSVNPLHLPAFETLASSLSSSQPCFGARGDEITILTSPVEFKAALLEMIKRARRRIIISSLYIGVEEEEIVAALKTALSTYPHLRVGIILDYHRATRLSPSSRYPASTAHLLLPLLERHSDRCEVWLFRSPKLKGIMEKIVPQRFDEGWGTWHGKWYGVDDEVILSGANLATSYFTNRQDRYIHFRSHPTLLSYLFSLTRLFTHYSYLLSPSPPPSVSRHHLVPLPSPPSTSRFFGSAALVWPTPSVHPRGFSAHAFATISAFQNSWRASNAYRLRRVDVDTWFWPVIQAGFMGMKEEETSLAKIWEAVREVYDVKEGERIHVDLTSGYFGLHKAYKKAIIDSPAPIRVIAASPKANGFYGSAGLSRLIPEGYTLLESRFWKDVADRGRSWESVKGIGVRLREWEREGWTYHAKGIWLSPNQPPSYPFLTFIGSSNLSTRSINLDAELSVILMTSSPSLRRALSTEVKAIAKYAIDVGEETWKLEERRVSGLAKVLVALGIEGML